MRYKNGIGWSLAFVLVFLLSQDYFFQKWSPSTSLLGLPGWLFWFMGVHVVFIVLFYFFSKKFW